MMVVVDWARSLGDVVRGLPRSIPPGAVPYLARSARALRKVRTPRQAVEVFETETEHLLTVVMPLLVEHPLPVRSTASAKAIVAGTGGVAAAGQEAEALAAIMSNGAALPPLLPIMLATNLVALAVEVSVAASLRVHDLTDAGIEPDPNDVARDVILAMTGASASESGGGGLVTKRVVKTIVARVLSRWAKSLVPLVGIAYSSWDAQRTVDAIRTIPIRSLPAAQDTYAADGRSPFLGRSLRAGIPDPRPFRFLASASAPLQCRSS
jgi:hypothetical protein